ncbi:DUF1592 domain-containing protein [Sorangium sp. So ce233]|uniref:DUF1592 domain-containing protein n=1 Tax=Sorangium sp. So ce233 TaxID=3133290 RepID=UPI003F638E56
MRMRTLRHLSYIGTTIFLASTPFFAGCTGEIADGADDDGSTSGSTGGDTGGGTTLPPPEVCVPGIPATTQIPRMLNRQYENTVRDLLGVSTVGTERKAPSELLVSDFDGPMTPPAWSIYQDVAAQIAKDVMAGPNKSRFISCDPSASGCLEDTIKTFGRKAFRRPLSAEEVARFMKLGQTTPAGTPDEVAETTLMAFLVSPSFLMLPELTATPSPSGKGLQLSSHEVATRLSYLLWGSAPDDVLNAAADANQLQTREQILAQAQRMIDVREKTGPLVTAFHRNWVQMDNGSAHWWKGDHDTDAYPLYSQGAKVSLQAELDAYFEEVAFAGGSYEDLLLSNIAFVNKDNAAIYGLDPSAYGAELTRVELDANERPGFLTRAGFLSSYSGYDATSPILRGAFIASYMLGADPGPPLPGATMLTVDGQFATQRAYVEELTKPEACAGCHAVVNPPGFVLEGYDAIGKVQTTDPRGGAIDASVTTATVNFGEGKVKEITSPLQLMQEIAQTPKAKQLYAQAWVAYAYGRAPNGNDKCLVDQLDMKLSQGGYSVLDLLADLTQTDSFSTRVRETQ